MQKKVTERQGRTEVKRIERNGEKNRKTGTEKPGKNHQRTKQVRMTAFALR